MCPHRCPQFSTFVIKLKVFGQRTDVQPKWNKGLFLMFNTKLPPYSINNSNILFTIRWQQSLIDNVVTWTDGRTRSKS